jgi:hypothetical protein
VDAFERRIGNALRLQPVDAAAMRLLRAERADIEAIPRQRMRERRIVDLGVG